MKLTQRIRGAYHALRGISGVSTLANPSPELIHAFGGQPSRAGVEVNARTTMGLSAVFACVRNLSEDLAKLPFNVYRHTEPAGKERLYDHPLYHLMNVAPNTEQTAFEVRQTLSAIAVLYGNGRAEIERNGAGLPINLWPIEPWRIRPRRDASGRLVYDIDNGRTTLAQQDVFDLRGFSVCGLVGEMVTSHGRDSFGVALAAQMFAATFFGNGARTSGLIKHPKKLSDKAYENLKRTWNQQYVGPDNAHATAILEEGADYVKTTTEPDEAQMIETRQFAVEDVARWFRMPPHKIGHLERAQGWSTMETANADYIVDTLLPWFERWEQESKRKLIRPSEADVFAEHLVAGMLRGDTAARYAAYNQALASGWMCIDEVRAMENLNPVPGGFGSIFRVPLNMGRIDAQPTTPTAPKPTDAGTPATEPPTSPATPAVEPPAPPATKSDVEPVRSEPMAEPTPAPVVETRNDAPMRNALRVLAADAVRRLLRVECDKVRRAAAKPDFAAWVDTFYGTHAEYVGNAMNPVCRAFNHPDFDAAAYAANAKRELLAAQDGTAAPSPEAVDAILSRWESDKPASIARQLAGE